MCYQSLASAERSVDHSLEVATCSMKSAVATSEEAPSHVRGDYSQRMPYLMDDERVGRDFIQEPAGDP
jgi:succinate dehydrogenase/fumarate reductase flavoprotein subunit